MTHEGRLILLPGLGADARLVQPQSGVASRVEVPAWIEPELGESLANYALRLSQQIDTSEPFFLGGVSFGGMVALEMARHLRPRAVFLLSSCRSPRGVRSGLRIGGALLPFVPPVALGWARHLPGVARYIFGVKTAEQAKLLDSILADVSLDFVHWGMRALLAWPGVEKLDVAVRAVHGELDRVLPAAKARADVVIAGAGHLANVTHAHEINDLLERWMGELK